METEEKRRKKSKKRNFFLKFEFDFYLICIEIVVKKTIKFKEGVRSPCNGNHFSSS